MVRAVIGAARATPAGSRAWPGRGRSEALEQWTESGTEYQSVDCSHSAGAAVLPSARALVAYTMPGGLAASCGGGFRPGGLWAVYLSPLCGLRDPFIWSGLGSLGP